MNDVPLTAIELLSGQKLSDFHNRNVWFYNSIVLRKKVKISLQINLRWLTGTTESGGEPVQIIETLSLFILFANVIIIH